MNPRVTVILTSYNRDTLLDGAIQSVISQSFRGFELFIMDDDSDNKKTHEVLDKYDGVDHITIYRHKLHGAPRFSRCGYGENINRAIEWSSGEFITYLTCDDVYLPGRLLRMVAHLDEHPDHDIVYGVQRLVRIEPPGRFVTLGTRDSGLLVPNGACLVDHNSVMHRRSVVDRVGKPLWPTDVSVLGMSDAVVWQKFADHNIPMHRLAKPEPTDEHRFHPDSIQAKGL